MLIWLITGENVPGSLCPVPPPPERMTCDIPCRMDCVLSEWTVWSSCSQSCSNKNSDGKQMRSRTILALAGEGELERDSTPFSSFLKRLHVLLFCVKDTMPHLINRSPSQERNVGKGYKQESSKENNPF